MLCCCGLELSWLGIFVVMSTIGLSNKVGLIIFVFIDAFCISGAADAVWRMWLAWYARTGYQRWTGEMSATASRLIRLADINDGTLVLQLVVAVVVAAWVS
jgi:hypothetical protein